MMMNKIYRVLMFALGMLLGSILIVMSWGIGAIAYAHRFITGRWPEWLTSRSGGAFRNES